MEDLSDELNSVALEAENIRKATSLYKVQLAQARKRSESNLSGWDRSESERTSKDNILDVEYKKSVFQQSDPPDDIKSISNQEEESEVGWLDRGTADETANDLRKLLFGEYPEPYPHSTSFQRVHVTSDDSQIDNDTLYACKKLKECIFLRNKWLTQHPVPPQDSMFYSTVVTSPLSSPGKSAGKKNVFRRRIPPVYDIFDQSLPTTDTNLRHRMVRGVMVVTLADANDVAGDLSLSLNEDGTLTNPTHTHGLKYHSEKSLYLVLSFYEFIKDYRRVTKTLLSSHDNNLLFNESNLCV